MSRRSDRFQRYDLETRVGMLEDDLDASEEKSTRRWQAAMVVGAAVITGLIDLLQKVH